ncbi:MAG: antibiotic biosynthesis monooxygenase [Acidobacteria bacterium]|nr:antibiotic biosynthesis monooxygenase [Acidobacteriota bacterium]
MYVIVWEFRVREGRENEFEQLYGPRGGWAQFFARDEGYLGTDLLHDASDLRRYFTVDRWETREAYERFRGQYAAEYETLDRRSEALMESEAHLGSFTSVE